LEAAARGPAREVLPESPRPAVTAAVALRSGSGHDEKPPTPSGSVCDPLTGLADRRVLVERLRASLATEEEPGPAVLLVDLDGFRSVNYSLGWDAGDRLLCEVARRLRSALRDADMVARFGSDEFAVLLDGVDTAAAEDVARRILEEVSEPIELGGLELFPLACIGVAVRAPAHGRAEDLMRDAERALVRARAFGKGRIEVFDPGLDARALTLSQLEVALRRALDNDEFRTHYEPMVSVKGGQVAGFEVLLWRKSSPPAARPR
jgi:diguanylate cyclase (GGDEF)-like protein